MPDQTPMTDDELAAYRRAVTEERPLRLDLVSKALTELDRLAAENAELAAARLELSDAMTVAYGAMNTLSEKGGEAIRVRDAAVRVARGASKNLGQVQRENRALATKLDAVRKIKPQRRNSAMVTSEQLATMRGWNDAVDAIREALEPCECGMTDPSTWETYGGATEPGSMYEPNPDCPEHGQEAAPESPRPPAEEGFTCFPTDPSTWTRCGDAVEPGSMYEPNPDCPEHGEEPAYMVVVPSIIGNLESWTTQYHTDGVRKSTRDEAIAHGLEAEGHDDWLIAIVIDDKLTGLAWQHEDRDDAEEVAEAAAALGLTAAFTMPDAPAVVHAPGSTADSRPETRTGVSEPENSAQASEVPDVDGWTLYGLVDGGLMLSHDTDSDKSVLATDQHLPLGAVLAFIADPPVPDGEPGYIAEAVACPACRAQSTEEDTDGTA